MALSEKFRTKVGGQMIKITITYDAEIPQRNKKMITVIGSIPSHGETFIKAVEAGINFLDSVCQKCGGFIRSYLTAPA